MLTAQKNQPTSQGLPPLIDRELLFGDPEITAAEVSPDGKYLAFLKPWSKTRNIWVKKTDEPFSAAKLLTTETKRPVAGYLWTRDGKFILYAKDKDGDENYNLFSVDPAASPAAGAEAPPSRDLTGLTGVRVQPYSVPKNDPDIVYIGLNDRDKAWHDLYKLKISTGERTLLRKNTDRISGWVFDLNGQLRLATRTADNGDQEILRADAERLHQNLLLRCFRNLRSASLSQRRPPLLHGNQQGQRCESVRSWCCSIPKPRSWSRWNPIRSSASTSGRPCFPKPPTNSP